MKQKILLVLCFLAMNLVSAQTFTVNNIEYTITGSEVQLTKGVSYSGALIVPSAVVYNTISYPVTSIGNNAFAYNPNLVSITIPNSVTSISEGAFGGCDNLTSVTIPNSVTSIGTYAFIGCTGLASVIIPNSVTSIQEGTFSGCTSLTSVTIPNSVVSIQKYAFERCTNLSTLICNITTPIAILPSVFYRVNKAACRLDVPVSSLSAYKTAVEWKDFKGITEKTFVVNNVNYTIIEGTTNVEVASSQCFVQGNLVIPSTVNYNSVTYKVVSIAEKAFELCYAISSVTIPNSVTSIEAFAFHECGNLTSVTIPNSVKSIKASAFFNCSRLTSITIPDKVVSIGENAVGFCTKLTSITIPNTLTSIENGTFKSCTALTSITIPTSITSIGSYAFENCSGLSSVEIPSSVTSVKSHAFSSCTNLTSVVIPTSITSIEESLFSNCKNLTAVTIPTSVTSIGYSAFRYCIGLTSITIPKSITYIGTDAFADCTNLTSVICAVETPLPIYSNVFENVNIAACSLEVPVASENAYKTANVWKDFKSVTGTLNTDTFANQKSVLYPNPFSNELFLELNNGNTAKVEVLDLNGKILLSKTADNSANKFDTGKLASGMYLVKISSENNTSVKKMIKK